MKYFTYKEFDCNGEKLSGKRNMDKQFLMFLDELRARCCFQFFVTSGWRSESHNKKVGGVKGSSHIKGLAADIAITDSKKRALFVGHAAELAHELDLPFRVGIAGKDNGNFCHIDIDKDKSSPRMWTY